MRRLLARTVGILSSTSGGRYGKTRGFSGALTL
jgi:hypothetical protein